MIKAILSLAVPVIAYGIYDTVQDNKAAKLLSVSFDKIKLDSFQPIPEILGVVNSTLSISVRNPSNRDLKLGEVFIQILDGQGRLIGELSQKKKQTITGSTESVLDFKIEILAKPIGNFVIDYFKTSKVPLTIKGYLDVRVGLFGQYLTIAFNESFDLKQYINQFSAEALADLIKAAK